MRLGTNRFGVFILLLVMFSPVSYSLDAKGTVDEVGVCTFFVTSPGWIRLFQFKVGGEWFFTFADYYSSGADRDNTLSTSLVLLAYSSKVPVDVRANTPAVTACGVTAMGIHELNGDYIRLGKR